MLSSGNCYIYIYNYVLHIFIIVLRQLFIDDLSLAADSSGSITIIGMEEFYVTDMSFKVGDQGQKVVAIIERDDYRNRGSGLGLL